MDSRMYIYAGQFVFNSIVRLAPLRGAPRLTSENFCPISSELFPSITPIEPTNATSYNLHQCVYDWRILVGCSRPTVPYDVSARIERATCLHDDLIG